MSKKGTKWGAWVIDKETKKPISIPIEVTAQTDYDARKELHKKLQTTVYTRPDGSKAPLLSPEIPLSDMLPFYRVKNKEDRRFKPSTDEELNDFFAELRKEKEVV